MKTPDSNNPALALVCVLFCGGRRARGAAASVELRAVSFVPPYVVLCCSSVPSHAIVCHAVCLRIV